MRVGSQDVLLPTTMVGNYPNPRWYDGQAFAQYPKGEFVYDAVSREAFEDAVGGIVHDQEAAGVDVIADGRVYGGIRADPIPLRRAPDVESRPRFARQSQDVVSEDVALHFGGAGVDRVGHAVVERPDPGRGRVGGRRWRLRRPRRAWVCRRWCGEPCVEGAWRRDGRG